MATSQETIVKEDTHLTHLHNLILFSFFLNSAILNPIKLLARSAEKIDKNLKSKPFIKGLKRSVTLNDSIYRFAVGNFNYE